MTRKPVTHIIHCDKCEDYDRLAADVEGMEVRVKELEDAANEREIFYAGVLNDAEDTRCSLRDALAAKDALIVQLQARVRELESKP